MSDLILCAIVFVIAFLSRYLIYYFTNKSKNKKKSGISVEMQYLINKFKLDSKEVNKPHIAMLLSLIDALIIVIALLSAITISKNIVIELLIGLVVVICLIIGVNELLGRILLKKGYGKK